MFFATTTLNLALLVLWPAAPGGARVSPPAPLLRARRGVLDPFFRAVLATRLNHARTRISYFADSVTNMDIVTHPLRQLFTHNALDGGPGWLPPGSFRLWTRHRGVKVSSSGWRFRSIMGPTTTLRRYGYGGLITHAPDGGGQTTYSFRHPQKNRLLRFGFITHPYGGRVRVTVDHRPLGSFTTRGPRGGYGSVVLRYSGAFTHLRLYNSGVRFTHLSDVSVEGRGGGVIVDSLGIVGSRLLHHLLKDQGHWYHALERFSPHLLLFHFGLNDSSSFYTEAMSQRATRFLKGIPCRGQTCSCLVVGVTDRVVRRRGTYQTTPQTYQATRFYRSLADRSGCAFFETQRAMGGERAAIQWYKSTPKLIYGDLEHLTPKGGARLASLLHGALMRAYGRRYKRQRTARRSKPHPMRCPFSPPPLPGSKPAPEGKRSLSGSDSRHHLSTNSPTASR